LDNNLINGTEAGVSVGLYFIFIILMYIIDRIVVNCHDKGEAKMDPSWGMTHFSIEEIYEHNLHDQLGSYSQVKEKKYMYEYIRNFLTDPAWFEDGDSKVQNHDYDTLKHVLEGNCIIERMNYHVSTM